MSEPKIVTGKVEPDRKLSAGLRILIRMEWDREWMVMLTMKRMIMLMMNRYFEDIGMTGLYCLLFTATLIVVDLLKGNRPLFAQSSKSAYFEIFRIKRMRFNQ